MSTEADTTHYSEFVKEMVNHFNVLTKDHKELQELGFGEYFFLPIQDYTIAVGKLFYWGDQ